jgi:hypothetical protein
MSSSIIKRFQTNIDTFSTAYGHRVWQGIGVIFVLLLYVLLAFAIVHSFSGAVPLLTLLILAHIGVAYFYIAKPYAGPWINVFFAPTGKLIIRAWNLTIVGNRIPIVKL